MDEHEHGSAEGLPEQGGTKDDRGACRPHVGWALSWLGETRAGVLFPKRQSFRKLEATRSASQGAKLGLGVTGKPRGDVNR